MTRGNLEHADRWGVAGWLASAPAARLEVLADGHLMAYVCADQYRPDLLAAGIADGLGAFAIWFDTALPPDRAHRIEVRLPDGRHLPGSPRLLPAATPPPTAPWRPDAGPPLALMVDEAPPDPSRDAASSALLSHGAALSRLGYAVHFAALADLPVFLTEHAGQVRLAYLHRLRPAQQAASVRAANPGVRVIYAVADLAHLREARRAAVQGGLDGPGLRAAELAAACAADAVVTHSDVEAALLRAELPGQRIAVVRWATSAQDPPPLRQREGIGFIGNFGHAPNRDAADILLDRIMPQVWRHAPIPCLLAGHGMPPNLRARAEDRVLLCDPLPDATAFWRRIRVSAAPLRFGAGVKGKVLDSLAAGVPCVASEIAAEGLDLAGCDIVDMAAELLRLHGDADANAAAVAAGRRMLVDADSVARALRDAL